MSNQKKVKLVLMFAILIVIALVFVSVYQIIDIAKTKKHIETQQTQIEQLQKELDQNQNKLPQDNYEDIIEENKWL